MNLAPYQFYMKTTGSISEHAFSGVTVPLGIHADNEVRIAVIAMSREKYGTSKATVERHMEELFAVEPEETAKRKPSSKSTI